jgi:hypothetical protein
MQKGKAGDMSESRCKSFNAHTHMTHSNIIHNSSLCLILQCTFMCAMICKWKFHVDFFTFMCRIIILNLFIFCDIVFEKGFGASMEKIFLYFSSKNLENITKF